MRITTAVAATSLLAGANAYQPSSTLATDALAVKGLLNLALYEAGHNPPPTCNTQTGYIRQEWSSLSATQKKAYISAVQCLQSKPSISGAIAPGARTRYDDFVATHINQTLTIHGTVSQP
jgi:tyrosinase